MIFLLFKTSIVPNFIGYCLVTDKNGSNFVFIQFEKYYINHS